MKWNRAWLAAMGIVIVMLMTLVAPAVRADDGVVTVATDKSDYTWFSTVHISGTGFAASGIVSVSVTDPNGNVTSWDVSTDADGSFATDYELGDIAGNYTVDATDGPNDATTTFHDANEAANLDQCTNGEFKSNTGVVVLEPCLEGTALGGSKAGTSFSNWVNGNSNGGKSHWREGDFIAYRVDVTGLSAGTHNIVFHYDTVHSGKHAMDYLGSFDYTETTALSSTAFHYDFNNPCVDLLGTTVCPQSSPPTPASSIGVPSATLTNCDGSAGTFAGSQIAGSVKAFAPSGSVSLTGLTYTAENVPSGQGQCSTTMRLDFTTTSGTSEVVLTWGGHIASESDWGAGNSASAINGSPYHMALDTLDGASTGSQDRALATTAIFFSPTISTTIKDASNNPVTSVPVGTTVHDTATLSGASSNAGGTVTYSFYTGSSSCSGTPSTESASVTNGIVADSSPHGPLLAGAYSFKALYSGDSLNLPATSACEPLTVGQGSTTTTTALYTSTGTPIPVGSSVPLGTSVYDIATVGPQVDGITITGTVTYSFFSNGACSGPATSTFTVPVGTASGTVGPLGVGAYSFQATYSGDSNYQGSTSSCEPFSVSKAATTSATALFTSAGVPIPVGSSVPLGTSVYDTATVGTQVDGFVIGGTVTYHFYANGACSDGSSDQTVTMSGGLVPNSASHGPLAAGSYSFKADYSGNSNYNPSTSGCEYFAVNTADTSVNTDVVREDTGASVPLGGSVPLGTTVHDTATVGTQVDALVIGGTVTYHFYMTGDCSGASSDQTVPMAGGLVPNSASHGPLAVNSYSFQATYSGDANYNPSTSGCEYFTVGQGSPTLTTTIVPGGPYALGAVVQDTATFGGLTTGFDATGTVTYTFYDGGICSGSVLSIDPVAVGAGSVIPPSANTAALAAGAYSFRATYGGDSNYSGAISACEPFTVGKGDTVVSTTIVPAGPYPLGSTVYDTATVGPQVDGFVISGTVTYHFYTTVDCTGAPSDEIVTMAGGLVPDSGTHGPLAAGPYSFQATYGGDSNYNGATSACEPLPVNKADTTMSTTIIPSGAHALGATVYDTATVSGTVDSFTITGTVTYHYFEKGFFPPECIGTPSDQTVTMSGGTVPVSSLHGPLAAGNYAFKASYSGDSNYYPSTSACEPFTVDKGSLRLSTTIDPASPVPLGTAVHDTATFGGLTGGFDATGSVTYTFYSGTCPGTVIWTQTVTIGAGSLIPNSQNTAALAAGSYSFKADYSGNSNYNGATSDCEPLTVNKADTTMSTTIIPSGAHALGATVYDTATVSGTVDSFTITGTVTYHFYAGSSTCIGTPSDQPVTMAGGLVPDSGTHGPLAAGPYSFQATYGGDSNYNGATSDCEPLTVNKADTAVSTTVIREDTGASVPPSSSVPLATIVHDTATVTASPQPFAVTGTVTYYFYKSDDCTGTPADQPVTMFGGSVPDSSSRGPLAAGTYGFKATYGGDSNYNPSTSDCEPFSVNKADTSTTTAIYKTGTTTPDIQGTPQDLGVSVYDKATVGPQVGTFALGGAVTYQFFTTFGCTGASTSQTVSVGASSSSHGPLAAGYYSFLANYSGNGNYNPSTGVCEHLTVNGKLEILKFTFPSGSTQQFNFTTVQTTPGPGPLSVGTFPLFDGGMKLYPSLAPETYTVTETKLPGWALMSLSCKYADGSALPNGVVSVDIGNLTVTIHLQGTTKTVVCTFQNGQSGFVTDSALCAFDFDNNPANGQTFRLLLTQDPASPAYYKVTATNPGQFFYNLIFDDGAPTTHTVTLTFPYPFVTQGAVPIHVYDSVSFVTQNGMQCLQPGTAYFTSTAQVTLSSYTGSAGSNGLFGTTTSLTVTFTSSSTGMAYLNVHLDYGLKGTTGWSKAGTTGNDALGSGPYAGIYIYDQGKYTFSFSATNDGSATSDIHNSNAFKKDPGFAGLVTNSYGNALAGRTVIIYNPDGSVLATLTTDQDGVYAYFYKYTGKGAWFTIKLPAYNITKQVYVKSNSFVWTEFVVPGFG